MPDCVSEATAAVVQPAPGDGVPGELHRELVPDQKPAKKKRKSDKNKPKNAELEAEATPAVTTTSGPRDGGEEPDMEDVASELREFMVQMCAEMLSLQLATAAAAAAISTI